MTVSRSKRKNRELVIVAWVGRQPSRRAAVRQAVREALGRQAIKCELRLPVGREQLLEALPGAAVLFGFQLDEEMLGVAEDLQWVHLGISGVDAHLPPSVQREGLLLTNSRGLHGSYMTEYVLGVILARSKCLFRFRDLQHQQKWEPRSVVPDICSVEGTTLGVLGLGSVGRHLAPRAAALGMKVVGLKRTPIQGTPPHGVDRVFGPGQLDDFLRLSDWLAILLPLTSETRVILSRGRISRIKKGAYVINVGRGELIDEKALLHAVERGRLSGAALDVFHKEPLPAGSKLWKNPDVLVTPHVAGNFPGYVEAAARLFGENLALYTRRQPLQNAVEPDLGY